MSLERKPHGRLFRLTKPLADGCTHAGELRVGGVLYTLTARVAEEPHGKEFKLYAQPAQAALAHRSKVPRGTPPAGDLVSQADAAPFDDFDSWRE